MSPQEAPLAIAIALAPRAKETGPANAPQIVTSKNWVLPPRPKPGRKPTAGSAKKKAVKSKTPKKDSDKADSSASSSYLRSAANKKSSQKISKDSRSNKRGPAGTASEKIAEANLNGAPEYHNMPTLSTSPGSSFGSAPSLQSQLVSSPGSSPGPHSESPEFHHPVLVDSDDCGLCDSDNGCVCSTLGIKSSGNGNITATLMPDFRDMQDVAVIPLKRSVDRPGSPLFKLKRAKDTQKPDYSNDFETDFTSAFTPAQQPKAIDPCGFCSNGTPCICADAAAKETGNNSHRSSIIDDEQITLPPLVSAIPSVTGKLPTLHPGPSRDISSVLSGLHSGAVMNDPPAIEDICTPGSCLQCKNDPMSTLFCTALALQPNVHPDIMIDGDESTGATGRDSRGTVSSCKGPGGAGGCCGGGIAKETKTTPGFIPCATAYQTLSRHKNFPGADLSKIVSKLQRQGMTVGVSSVADALRELDKRLYH
ncbi:hypothetical protein CANCADRAFT_1842 [Tortispora caseinolytica NRRL Y-17796]|uniref:Hap4 transcription factor heteromerisation domain-containing protein n=1 Tax=Tortispora caseinolytica NRRL Y-17796 TaxID=767744 RepID=A0A1E4TEC0_9ASCO|nr:hypothetical protein CANCADRAFT_1842 [Tortispora caseinolytica NRRL Y-17796]